MIRLALRFPSGRFHATPWDHHVNEGIAEWPPSPWRIVRALASALHTRCPELSHEVAWSALGKLGAPPSFTLPAATVGHTRHYLAKNERDRAKTSLTFDTFVAVASEQSIVHWPCDLSGAERRAVAALAREVSYLGRAESWCELELIDDGADVPAPNCAPSDGTAAPETTTVRVLCAAEGFAQREVERATSELQREGWNDPPGTRWVLYRRRADALATLPQRRGSTSRSARGPVLPMVAELALGGTVLPLFTDAVRIGEKVRAAAMKHHGEASPTFAGKDAAGVPSQGQHRHAHFLPEARGRQGRVTHVIVYAPIGFTEREQDALASITYLTQEDRNRPPLDVALLGFGQQDNWFDASRAQASSRIVARGRRWRSATPFVLTRHVKRNSDSPEEQLVRELALRGIPAPSKIERVAGVALGDRRAGPAALTRWVEFHTRRRHDRHDGAAVGFVIEFDEPIEGPIVIGYGCHYGLGQFAVDD